MPPAHRSHLKVVVLTHHRSHLKSSKLFHLEKKLKLGFRRPAPGLRYGAVDNPTHISKA
jgi:hypothetical protein